MKNKLQYFIALWLFFAYMTSCFSSDSNRQNLTELENVNQREIVFRQVYIPNQSSDLTNQTDFCLELPDDICSNDRLLPPEFDCRCEWTIWRERGLTCFGVVCSEFCEPEIIACHETEPVCVVQ